MSRKCEQCGSHIQSHFAHTTPILRRAADTGYTYRFCSDACASQWRARHDPPPHASDSPDARRIEEDRQIDQRWLGDGGASAHLA